MVLCMEQHRLKEEKSALRSRVSLRHSVLGWMKTNHEGNDRDLFTGAFSVEDKVLCLESAGKHAVLENAVPL
jgi:hypothetical protein